jgi:hypothetical protein
VPSRIDNAKHWRARAEQTLALANQMTHEDSKQVLLGIAHGYAQLARMAEARKADRTGRTDRFP